MSRTLPSNMASCIARFRDHNSVGLPRGRSEHVLENQLRLSLATASSGPSIGPITKNLTAPLARITTLAVSALAIE